MEAEVEVMNVVRVPPLGKLMVKVGNGWYQHISEVNDAEVRQRLMAAIGELVVFADGYEALESAGLAPPLSTEVPSLDQPVSPSLEQRQTEFLKSLQRERDLLYATNAESLDSEHPMGTERTGFTGPLSLVGQVNPILKKHVAADDKLQGRNIKLHVDPAGGLLIEVDGNYYKRPDEIEDPDVRRVIRAALKEWDRT